MQNNNFLWAVFFLLILPLAGYTVYSGLVVGQMELPGGFKISFQERGTVGASTIRDGNLDELSESELTERQEELEKRLEELEQNKRNGTGTTTEALNENQIADLNGFWYGQGGLSYQISQSGTSLTIQEINPLYGVTAIGQGEVQGQSVDINYQTAAYTQGVGNLTLSADGQTLNGTFTDSYSGYRVPVRLHR